MTLSETQASRHPFDDVGLPHWLRASPNYPDRLLRMPSSLPRWIGLVLSVRFGAIPRPVLPRPLWPSLSKGQVGFHIFSFEACSSFTHVTACGVARPPIVDFVTRLQSGRLPSRTARQLPSHTDNSLGGSFPHW